MRAREGDMVRVSCAGRLASGETFRLSDEPMEIFLGHGDLPAELEQAMVGLEPGESRLVILPKGKGYGPRREDLVQVVTRDRFPKGVEPKVGMRLRIPAEGFEVVDATIVEVTETDVTLDGNHPLAGEDVLMEIKLLSILQA